MQQQKRQTQLVVPVRGYIIKGLRSGGYKLLGVRKAQGYMVQHWEYNQYFIITVNRK